MLAGYFGHLLSEAFLEDHIARSVPLESLAGTGRALAHWRQRERAALGPASSLRTMLHLGAAPLLATVGFDRPSAIETFDTVPVAIAATISGPSDVCVLL